MFVWTEVPRPRGDTNRRAMYKKDLEERAAMMLRLGYPSATIKARLAANVAWDFDLSARPAHAAEIDAVVDAVSKRQSRR